jgi:hypothetical protein
MPWLPGPPRSTCPKGPGLSPRLRYAPAGVPCQYRGTGLGTPGRLRSRPGRRRSLTAAGRRRPAPVRDAVRLSARGFPAVVLVPHLGAAGLGHAPGNAARPAGIVSRFPPVSGLGTGRDTLTGRM